MNAHFETWQWVVAFSAATLVGISKTGFAGLGMLFVALFALIMPAKQATGIVLPLLCFGDVVAVLSYRRHTQWIYLWRLFPWTAAGVFAGYFALNRMSDRQTQVAVGIVVLGLLGLHLLRRSKSVVVEDYGWWFAPTIGVLAGFTTLIANAAGPLMVIYLLATRLPKLEYVGTGAVFFMLLNLFKVPFMINLGLITGGSFQLNLILLPAVLTGALLGRWLLTRIDQKVFENLALVLSALAGAKLLFW